MTISYLFRLVCLSLASFFLIHAALGALLAVVARPATRIAERIEARHAARLLLTLRLLPAGAAYFAVAAFCVPSYIWLEPKSNAEQVGLGCAIAAILGLALCVIPLVRCGMALAGSVRFLRACQRSGHAVKLPGESAPGWAIDATAPPIMALAGAVRPRMVISTELLLALSPDQLEAAMHHERAHRISRDNLKRLALLAAPDLIPFINPWRTLERSWARLAEWSADDAAAGGDTLRSLSLAEALVKVAGARPAPHPSPLVASLVGCGADLEVRVNRLLNPELRQARRVAWSAWAPMAAIAMLVCGIAATAIRPAALSVVHDFLEHLIA